MPFISITRLRLRSPLRVPRFAFHTYASLRQCRRAPGLLDGVVMADRHWTFWTLTAWHDQAAMRGYMTTGTHRKVMPKLMEWCDEASIAHWWQDDPALPSWDEADRRMRAEGRPSKVHRPSATHLSLAFAKPRTVASGPIIPS